MTDQGRVKLNIFFNSATNFEQLKYELFVFI